MYSPTRPIALALCLALALIGCGAEDGSLAPAFDRIGGVPLRGVPLRGACATSYELTDPVLANEKDLVSADYHDSGSCRLSQLGAATVQNEGSIDFSTVPALGTGTFTLVAANGDRLEGTERIAYDLPNERGVFGFSGTRTITSGTGRFAEARGSIAITGTGSTVANTTDLTFAGRLDE